MNKTDQNHCTTPCVDAGFLFRGEYRNVLPDHTIRVRLTRGEAIRLFSEVVVLFERPSVMYGSYSSSHPRQPLWWLVFLISRAQVSKSDTSQILGLLLANP